jgi:hypothetical protein
LNNVAGMTLVDSATGAFQLHVDTDQPVHVIVVHGCSIEDVTAERFLACLRFFPRHAAVKPGASGVILQVPDPNLAAALWRGESPPASHHGAIGWLLIVFGLILGLTLRARARKRGPPATPPAHKTPNAEPHWLGPALALATALVLLPGLGSEPLDLLEYSYFHEGVRPDSASALFTDFTSAELAHGPIMPIILRVTASVSRSPWALRLPSVLFGILSILCVFSFVRRELGRNAALGAALMILVTPVALFYHRDATPYAFTGLCAAASIWVALRARDSQKKTRWWVLFAIIQLLGFFAHYGFAFASASLALALLFGWWKTRPDDLWRAILAFTASAILPVLLAPHLVHMFVASGIRFSLMSPVYIESPGLIAFLGQFFTVLSGLPVEVPALLLLVAVPLWALGLSALIRRARILAWIFGLQTLVIVGFLVFTHAMSTVVGGERVFYAYRWARPLLTGLAIPLGIGIIGRWRHATLALLMLVAWQGATLLVSPTRPALTSVQKLLTAQARPGDAYAVLPAGFYGDPLQYYLAEENPPAYITQMRAIDLPIGDTHIRGPLVEAYLTLETEIDQLRHERLWVIVVRERMFNTPKFDPGVADRTLAWLDSQFRRMRTWHYPLVSVALYQCDVECAWQGDNQLTIHPNSPLRAGRYIDGSTVTLPDDTRSFSLAALTSVEIKPGDLEVSGSRLDGPLTFSRDSNGIPHWEGQFKRGSGRIQLTIQSNSTLTLESLRIEARR